MSIVNTIKGAPRWTWYTVAGVSLGAVGIHVWRNRAGANSTDTTAADGTTPGDMYGGSTQPATSGGSPPGVIVPPIITQGGDGGSVADSVAAIGSLFGGAFTDLTSLVGTVVTGDQANINTLIAQQGEQSNNLIGMLAGAGAPPQPVAANPTPLNITVSAPTPVVSTPKAGAAAACPPSFPQYNPANGAVGPKSCYKDCGHDECHNGKKSREHAHCYQNGDRQTTGWDVIGGKC